MIVTLRNKGLLYIVATAKEKIARYLVDPTVVFLRFDTRKQPLPPRRNSSGTTIVTVQDPGEDNFAALCALFPDKTFPSRLTNDQQRCLIAITDGMVSAYGWVTTRSCRVSELNWTLSLDDNEIYIYDCFVLPEYRHRGIYMALLTTVLRECREYRGDRACRYVCIGSSLDNAVSLRTIRNMGFTEYFRVRYRRFRRKGRWLILNDRHRGKSIVAKWPSGSQHS